MKNTSVRLVVTIVAALLAGMMGAVQSRVNGGLAVELSSGYITACVSFGVGLMILAVSFIFSRRARQGFGKIATEMREGRLPRWTLVGGFAGAFFVLAQGIIGPLTGLALLMVGVVVGQVIGGLVIDRVGLGPSGRIDASLSRLIGTGLAIMGVIVSVAGGMSGSMVLLAIVPVLIGAAMSMQSMMNGLLRAAAGSALTATFVSFLAGMSLLVVIGAVSVVINGWPQSWPTEPWYYTGGVIGTIFVALGAILVRPLGVLLLSMSTVAGQLVGALALDALLPIAGSLTPWMVAGSTIALLAVAIAAIPGGGSRKLPRPRRIRPRPTRPRRRRRR